MEVGVSCPYFLKYQQYSIPLFEIEASKFHFCSGLLRVKDSMTVKLGMGQTWMSTKKINRTEWKSADHLLNHIVTLEDYNKEHRNCVL